MRFVASEQLVLLPLKDTCFEALLYLMVTKQMITLGKRVKRHLGQGKTGS